MKKLNTTNLFLKFYAFSLIIVCYLKTFWISDDSLITARVIINSINGYGPVFNIGERVQSFTHPLWFILNKFLTIFSGNVILSYFILSTFLVAGYLLIIFQNLKSKLSITLFTLLWCFSAGIRDFSSSGLENILSMFLLTNVIFLIYRRKNLSELFIGIFLLGLITLNRVDSILIVIPFFGLYLKYIYLLSLNKIKNILVSFFVFLSSSATYYLWAGNFYNDFLPNTFHAKTNVSISKFELILQGLIYFFKSILNGYLLLFLFFLVLIFYLFKNEKFFKKDFLSLTSPNSFLYLKNSKSLEILLISFISSILYIIYVFLVGGDFMISRFLAVPAFLILNSSVFFIDNLKIQEKFRIGSYKCALFLICLSPLIINIAPQCIDVNNKIGCSNISSNTAYNLTHLGNGIVNERSFYILFRGKFGLGDLYDKASIKRSKEILNVFDYAEYTKSPPLICGMLGGEGLKKIDQHIIDYCALTDSFLANLEFKPKNGWRIGHFVREVPDLYIDSIIESKNKFPVGSKEYLLLNEIWEKIRD